MKNLKNLIVLLSISVLLGCKKSKDSDPQPQLPKETQIGANTFGCKLNNEIWLPQGTFPNRSGLVADWQGDGYLNIVAASFTSQRAQYLHLHSDKEILAPGDYNLTNEGTFAGLSDELSQCEYGGPNYKVQSGVLTITKLDFEKRIIAGRFHFTLTSPTCSPVTITDGRFDITY